MLKILVLGGYGVFGGRLIHLLNDLADIEFLVGGRNKKAADDFCAKNRGAARLTPLAIDRRDIATHLQLHKPALVVDASGPFQQYGDDPYNLVRACINAGINYLDFADAADFVFGIDQFDAAAKAAGVFVFSGVSSFPVLTAAVLREMSKLMQIQRVTGGIAPSPYAGIGLNVMRAVVGYAGAPIKLQRRGQLTTAYGLTESMRYTVAVPGHKPLRNIHFSLVEVPDLQVIPKAFVGITDLWMGAGPVPESLHRLLNCLAWLRAKFNLPSFAIFSQLFYVVLNLAIFGEHRGGMFIDAHGIQDGKPVQISWHLLAEGDHGPLIPSMAIEMIVRKLLNGERPASGARSGIDALSLDDYRKCFGQREIYMGWRQVNQSASLFERVLGSRYQQLPATLKALHDKSNQHLRQPQQWYGQASVQRGTGLLARMVAKAFSFPQSGDQVPVTVSFHSQGLSERWVRKIGRSQFESTLTLGTGKNEHLLIERFGVVAVAVALVWKNNRLYFVPRSWSLMFLPLPKFMLPEGSSYETEIADQFNFNISIVVPLIGVVIQYQGWLQPQNN